MMELYLFTLQLLSRVGAVSSSLAFVHVITMKAETIAAALILLFVFVVVYSVVELLLYRLTRRPKPTKKKSPVSVFQGYDGDLPRVHFAIKNMSDVSDRFEVCKSLMSADFEINSRDIEGKTALHWLCSKRSKVRDDGKLLNLLIRNGADINAEDDLLNTPLLEAVTASDYETTQRLLKAGANPNVTNIYNDTVLFQSTVSECWDISKLLIDYKADVNDIDAIHTASEKNKEILLLMFERGSDLSKCKRESKLYGSTNSLIRYLAEYKRIGAIKCLLEHGIDDISDDALASLYNNVAKEYSKNASIWSVFRSCDYLDFLNDWIKFEMVAMQIQNRELKTAIRNLTRMPVFRHSFERYRKQLEKMKARVSSESSVTFFDLLTKKGDELKKCCTDDNIEALLDEIEDNTFPDFTELMIKNVNRVLSNKIKRGIQCSYF